MGIARNSTYNIIGTLIPIAIAVATVPLYIRLVGDERFGVLAVIWAMFSYFGMFDLGLGRATSYFLVNRRDSSDADQNAIFATALAINIAIGMVGGLLLWAGGSYFLSYGFKADAMLRAEALSALPIVAASVPIATATGMLVGALNARDRFLETNVAQSLSTILFQIIPLVIAWLVGPHLLWLMAGAVAARAIAVVMLWRSCRRLVTGHVRLRPARRYVWPLLEYGGWVTVSTLMAPLFPVIDRFVIGNISGAALVTAYAVPADLTRRLTAFPLALSRALFPRLSGSEAEEAARLATAANRALLVVMTLPVLVALFLMDSLLTLWLGARLADAATGPARLLLIGIWFNSLAYIPFIRLQAARRPASIARITALELPFYVAAMVLAVRAYGIEGAAAVALARCAIDLALLRRVAGDGLTDALPIALHALPLLIAAAIASRMTISEPGWWLALLGLGGLTIAASYHVMPQELRRMIAQCWGWLRTTAGQRGSAP